MTHIKLLFALDGPAPLIKIKINGAGVNSKPSWIPDEFGNVSIELEEELSTLNIVDVEVSGLLRSINLVEIIADDIRFGLVTFLCTTISGKQDTQLTCDGVIKIALGVPIWQYWCEKFNSFNYKDYPLGSTN